MTLRPPTTMTTGTVATLGIILYAAAVFLRGAILMLLFLALHAYVSSAVPAVGYWHCVIIGMLLGALFNFRFNVDKD